MAGDITKLFRGALGELRNKLRSTPLVKSLPEVTEFDSWHGSPRRFAPEEDAPLGRFRDDKINTGEGAQAFTYGHYSTGSDALAKEYRDALARAHGTAPNAWQTKKEIAQVAPDMIYAPPLAFSKLRPDSPKFWLSDRPQDRYDAMIHNGRWLDKYVNRYMNQYVAEPYKKLSSIDPETNAIIEEIIGRKNDPAAKRLWLPEDKLEVARQHVGALRQLQSARDVWGDVAIPGRIPDELRAEILKQVNLPSNAEYVKLKDWKGALNRLANTMYVPGFPERLSDYRNTTWQGLLNYTDTGKELKRLKGLPEDYDTKWLNRDMALLGRTGMLDYAKQLTDPSRVAELRQVFGVDNMPDIKSLYKVHHKMSPADMWFLDIPLVGQETPFIEKFLNAGRTMSPGGFGVRPALQAPGMTTYRWLLHEPSAKSNLSSWPGTRERNKEISDRLKEQNINGAMFLRGGYRDLDRALQTPFNPEAPNVFNFVTYDPAKTDIIERFKKGGLVQYKECGCG